ncbi:hypothetical protein AO361_24630 [Pseudomonas fluorescens]|nr:hypothetical protein AO361_24630 [Pseudomonas fluorescens]
MVVNDNAGGLVPRGVLESIASKLAPTVKRIPMWERACSRWSLTITRDVWLPVVFLSPSRASSLLQSNAFPCGSELARDGR